MEPDNTPIIQDSPINRKRIFPILLIIFTNILGAGVIIPILPLYAEGQFQGTILQITLLNTVFFGAQFLAAPWLGRLSDRFGRRPLLIISQAGTVVAFILFILAGPLGRWVDSLGLALPLTGGMVMLYLARTLDGVTGGNISIAQAYISDVTTPQQRTQGLGFLQAAFGLGFVFGPAFGGVLSAYGPTAPFIGAAVITTGTLLLTTFTLVESLPPSERGTVGVSGAGEVKLVETLRKAPALGNVLVVGLVTALAFSAFHSTFALFADHVIFADSPHPERIQLYIGLMLAFNGVIQVVTQIALLKPFVKWLGDRGLLVFGQAALMLGMVGVGLILNPILITLLFAPVAFGRGVSEPVLQNLTTRFGSKRSRGKLLGFYQSGRSLGMIIGPIWTGYVFEAISPQAVFLVGAGMVLLNTTFAWRLKQREIPGGESRA
jgi:DHA1 family tetracycline resistance protein-like MFS transporter